MPLCHLSVFRSCTNGQRKCPAPTTAQIWPKTKNARNHSTPILLCPNCTKPRSRQMQQPSSFPCKEVSTACTEDNVLITCLAWKQFPINKKPMLSSKTALHLQFVVFLMVQSSISITQVEAIQSSGFLSWKHTNAACFQLQKWPRTNCRGKQQQEEERP